MENHNFYWLNQLFLWPFSIAMFVYQRVKSELYLLYISWNITVDFGMRTWFQAILYHFVASTLQPRWTWIEPT
jgi:hypothetical protein